MINIRLSTKVLNSIIFTASGVVIVLGWGIVILDHLFSFEFRGNSLFNLMSESNLPTWFSSGLLATAALLLALIGNEQRRAGRPGNYRWFAISVVFWAMSLDETAMIHERINMLMLEWGTKDYGGFMTFPWVLPGLIGVILFAFVFYPFFRSLPFWTKKLFFLAGLIFVSGGLGLEVAEGFAFRDPALQSGGVQEVIGCFQESMEIIGVTIFIYALLKYLAGCSSIEPEAGSLPT